MRIETLFPTYETNQQYEAKSLGTQEVVFQRTTGLPGPYVLMLKYIDNSLRDFQNLRKKIQSILDRFP